MRKILTLALCSSLLLSSCDTYTGSGAYAGGSLGAILGSAIGGIAGGPRGSDVGTLVGIIGGATVGAAMGAAADNAASGRTSNKGYGSFTDRHPAQRNEQSNYYNNGAQTTTVTPVDGVVDPTNSGDDRLYDFDGKDYTGNYTAQQPTAKVPGSTKETYGASFTYTPNLEIVNARFVDGMRDNVISRGETCKIIFEVMNRGTQTVSNVVPVVVETSGNKHIYISPSIHIESIEPGKGVRYTAMVKADNKLKDGSARFCVSVIQGGKCISKVNEFNIKTTK
jgi:hypothetical protein